MEENNPSSTQMIPLASSVEAQAKIAVEPTFSNEKYEHMINMICERFMYVHFKSKMHYECRQNWQNIERNFKLDN